MKTEYITVAEFAKLAGVSKQAVYWRIDKDLKDFVQVDASGSKTKKLISTGALPLFKSNDSSQFDSNLNNDSSELERLKEELRAKDKTIEALLQQTKTQQEQLQELTSSLADQGKELIRLLDQSQKLQAMAQKQIEAPAQSEPEDIQDVSGAEPAQEKKSFFSWLFHR